MSAKYVIDQDKENRYDLNVLGLHPFIDLDEKPCMGVRLLMDTTYVGGEYQDPDDCVCLGVFDTLDQVVKEIYSMCTNTNVTHQVSGYSNGGFARY